MEDKIEVNPENDKLKQLIVDTFVPAIIQELYKRGDITEDIDTQSLISTIVEKTDEELIGSLPTMVVISSTFFEAIKDEVENNRLDVAICLSGIYIEQITNEFYQVILQEKLDFSNVWFTECMKSVSIDGKLTWLFKLTTQSDLDSELVGKVKKLYSMRNKVVHYKPKSDMFDNIVKEDERELNTDEMLTTLITLKEKYTEKFEEMFPIYDIGIKLYEQIKEKQ